MVDVLCGWRKKDNRKFRLHLLFIMRLSQVDVLSIKQVDFFFKLVRTGGHVSYEGSQLNRCSPYTCVKVLVVIYKANHPESMLIAFSLISPVLIFPNPSSIREA